MTCAFVSLVNNEKRQPDGTPKSGENPENRRRRRLKGAFSRLWRPWRVVQRARSSGFGSITRPQWKMILKMSSGIRSSHGRRLARWLAAPDRSSRSILITRVYWVALVLGRGKLAKIEVALSNREDTG
jgi:hypothetical protein